MNLRDIGFAEIPSVGLAVTIAGQRFDLVEVEPYVRQDGQRTNLLVWSAACATCGVEFRSKSPTSQLPQSRCCPDHRKLAARSR